MPTIATVFGATGLVGGHLLRQLLDGDEYGEVRAVGRRSVGFSHPKLQEHVIDLYDEDALAQAIGGSETVFVSIGTTRRKVGGDEDAYRRIDFDIPVTAAKVAARTGVFGYALVSAVGADPDNNLNFYIKLKGVTEETVAEQAIPQVLIFRPSMLMGERSEHRPMERLGQLLMPFIDRLLRGSWKRYRSIPAADVARAMVLAARGKPKGIHILEYGEMRALVDGVRPAEKG